MIKKIIRQNTTFLLITLGLFLIFGSVLYIAMRQIYEREASLQHQLEEAPLLVAKQSIEIFFSSAEQDLLFLTALVDFETRPENDLKEIFYRFAESQKQFYKIRLIDSSGQEVIRIDNRPGFVPLIIPEVELRNRKSREYFTETIGLDKEQIYVSPIILHVETIEEFPVPLVRLGSSLFGHNGGKTGVLIVDINLTECLKLLPEYGFIQTEERTLISIGPEGETDFRPSDYVFTELSGKLIASDIETIHYSTMEILSGRTLILGMQHEHPQLQLMFRRLVMVTVILLVLLLFLTLTIDFINFSKVKELISAEKAIIFSLAGLTEGRDPETGAHLERTGRYSGLLAKRLAKEPKFRKIITGGFIDNIYDAAPLHDIGKVAVRDSILFKKGKLTEREFSEMKQHVIIGARVIQNAIEKFKLTQLFIAMSRNICAYHHEKYNGQGYPEGLKGEEIPLEARIFALCDAYDTIRSRRPYKEGLSHEKAVDRIKSDSGNHFDPDIVEVFLECEAEFARIHDEYGFDCI